jgi:Uma2 family endonuclease
MASVAPRTGRYTFDDFLLLVNEDQKADLLDGVIYMASPESIDDNKLGGWLYSLMSLYVEQLDLGEVYYTKIAFRITQKRGPEPDVAFVAKRRLHLVKKGFVKGPPDIAVEIVSPDSVVRDYEIKRGIYERAGVREYWIIDPDDNRATFLRRQRGKFREVELDGTVFHSRALPGFKIDARWLLTKRRPSALAVLQDLLAQQNLP